MRPVTKRGVGFVVAGSLLAVLLLVPAGVSAAIPTLVPSHAPAPATISDGGRGAVVFGIVNNDRSTVSQLFLVDIVVTGGTFVAAYPSQGTCLATCTLGQLKPTKSASVIVVFDATPGATTVTVTGAFNTTGLGSGSGDASHGDTWPVSQGVATSTDAQNFAGRFIDGANLIVLDDQAINDTTNKHATKVVAPKTFIGVTVSDGSVIAQPCTGLLFDCSQLFGETSVISVADGGTFATGFKVIISFDGSEIVGANANTLKIYHTYAGGAEVISTRCSFAPGSTTPKSLPCLTVAKGDGKDLVATIWTTHNGQMRGF